jgi:hypothetical protein
VTNNTGIALGENELRPPYSGVLHEQPINSDPQVNSSPQPAGDFTIHRWHDYRFITLLVSTLFWRFFAA